MKKVFINLLMLGVLTACNSGSDGGSTSASADTQNTEATETVDGNTSEVSEEEIRVNLVDDITYTYIDFGTPTGLYDFSFDADPFESSSDDIEVIFEICTISREEGAESTCSIMNTLICHDDHTCTAYDSDDIELSSTSYSAQLSEVSEEGYYEYRFQISDITENLYQTGKKISELKIYLKSGDLTGPVLELQDNP